MDYNREDGDMQLQGLLTLALIDLLQTACESMFNRVLAPALQQVESLISSVSWDFEGEKLSGECICSPHLY